MTGKRETFCILVLRLIFIIHCQNLGEIDVKTDFCSNLSYVNRIEFLNSGKLNSAFSRIDINVECQKFAPSSYATLSEPICVLRNPFPLEQYVLIWNDYLRNCRCNEYIGGIKHFYSDWNGNGISNGRVRRKLIQLQCCYSSNKEVKPPSCVYSGMESLQAPWNVSSIGIRESEIVSGQNYAIQGLLLFNGSVNARLCEYKVSNNKGYELPTSGIKSCWSGVDYDCSANTDLSGICSNEDESSMYGWKGIYNFNNDRNVALLKNNDFKAKQVQLCRSGYRLLSFTKKTLHNGGNKLYQFDIKCTPFSSRTCFCVWLASCPTGSFFGISESWYVAGIRNEFSASSKNTNLEILCCQTPATKTITCTNEIINKDKDADTFSLNDKTFQFQFPLKSKTTISLIQNIESFYDNDVLNLRFNVCSAVYTYGWCYNDPCYWCRSRAYRDGRLIGGSGYWSAQDSNTQVSRIAVSRTSMSDQADYSLWDSWSGWSEWSGSWGNCNGLSKNTFWSGNSFQGKWSSWNSWRRDFDYQDDYDSNGCKTCRRATPFGKYSRKRFGDSERSWTNRGWSNWSGWHTSDRSSDKRHDSVERTKSIVQITKDWKNRATTKSDRPASVIAKQTTVEIVTKSTNKGIDRRVKTQRETNDDTLASGNTGKTSETAKGKEESNEGKNVKGSKKQGWKNKGGRGSSKKSNEGKSASDSSSTDRNDNNNGGAAAKGGRRGGWLNAGSHGWFSGNKNSGGSSGDVNSGTSAGGNDGGSTSNGGGNGGGFSGGRRNSGSFSSDSSSKGHGGSSQTGGEKSTKNGAGGSASGGNGGGFSGGRRNSGSFSSDSSSKGHGGSSQTGGEKSTKNGAGGSASGSHGGRSGGSSRGRENGGHSGANGPSGSSSSGGGGKSGGVGSSGSGRSSGISSGGAGGLGGSHTGGGSSGSHAGGGSSGSSGATGGGGGRAGKGK